MNRTPQEFIAHAGSVAGYYGFKPLRDVDPQGFKSVVGRALPTFDHAVRVCAGSPTMREREPVLAYFASPTPSAMPEGFSARDTASFDLHVANVPQALGDTIVIKTTVAILQEWGAPIVRVRINALGDRDSRERHARELTAFVRRRFATEHDNPAHEAERRAIIEQPSHLYHSKACFAEDALAEAPRSVHFLSERSRAHFKELLEHLENIEVPYELDDTLRGDDREARIAFHIDLDESEGDNVVRGGMGGRFDDHVARLVNRRDYPTVHSSIFFAKHKLPRTAFVQAEITPPRLYFIQLGIHAKLCGLAVVDTLRHAHIPIAQSFDTTRLSPQLHAAESTGVPLVLIMGEREARDHTVIVRRVSNSSQTAVPIGELSKYLRGMKV